LSGQTFNDYAHLFQHKIEREEFSSHVHYARFNPNYVNPFGMSQNDLQEVAANHQLRLYKPFQPFFNYRFSENNLRNQLFFATTRESFEPGFFSPGVFGVPNLDFQASFSRQKAYSNPSGILDTTTDMITARPAYAIGPVRMDVSVGRILQTDSVQVANRSREWNLGGSIEGNWELDDWRVNPSFFLGYQNTDSVGIQHTDLQQRTLIQRMLLANKQLGEIVCSHVVSAVHRPSIQFDPGDPTTDINQSFEQTGLELEVSPKLPATWKEVLKLSFVYQSYDTSFTHQKAFDFHEEVYLFKAVASF